MLKRDNNSFYHTNFVYNCLNNVLETTKNVDKNTNDIYENIIDIYENIIDIIEKCYNFRFAQNTFEMAYAVSCSLCTFLAYTSHKKIVRIEHF